MQVTKQTKNSQEKQELPLNLPESCLACHSLEVMTQPVYLTELDGKVTQAGYVARCVRCGYIKSFGLHKGIGRLVGRKLRTDFAYWPVLRRNNITPDEWIGAVINAAENKGRMVWLDARNGLLPAEPEGKYAEVIKRWKGLLNAKPIF